MLYAPVRQTKLYELHHSAGDPSPGEQGQLHRSWMEPAVCTAAPQLRSSRRAASRARSRAGSAVQPSKVCIAPALPGRGHTMARHSAEPVPCSGAGMSPWCHQRCLVQESHSSPCSPSPPPQGSPPVAALGLPARCTPHPLQGQRRRQNILLPKALQVNKPSIPKFPIDIGTSIPPPSPAKDKWTTAQIHTRLFHRKHSSDPLGWDCFPRPPFFSLRRMIFCWYSLFQASERPIAALLICHADAQRYHRRAQQKPHR